MMTGRPIRSTASSASRVVLDDAGPGQDRNAGLLHRRARRDLVAHEAHDLGLRADPVQAALLHHLGEVRVLGQEAVARVDRVGARDLGGADDRRDVEVARARRRRTDADLLVGEADVQRVGVGGRVDGDRADPHLPTGTDDPQRDLAAVRYENLFKHAAIRTSQRG